MKYSGGQIKKMKVCTCQSPKEWHGDNYCRKCEGIISSKLFPQGSFKEINKSVEGQ